MFCFVFVDQDEVGIVGWIATVLIGIPFDFLASLMPLFTVMVGMFADFKRWVKHAQIRNFIKNMIIL